jgi:hypothetical protein
LEYHWITERKYLIFIHFTYSVSNIPINSCLDAFSDFTKLDWLYWIAAMGTNEQFNILNEKAYEMVHRTPQRVPLTDWYNTMNANMVGFKARPVIGGLYARMLLSPYHCSTHNCKI